MSYKFIYCVTKNQENKKKALLILRGLDVTESVKSYYHNDF